MTTRQLCAQLRAIINQNDSLLQNVSNYQAPPVLGSSSAAGFREKNNKIQFVSVPSIPVATEQMDHRREYHQISSLKPLVELGNDNVYQDIALGVMSYTPTTVNQLVPATPVEPNVTLSFISCVGYYCDT
jgi:hypothetical protein